MKRYRKGVFIVVYRKEKDKIKYLLLKRKLHWKGWEFPKGGIEEEPEMIAVKRETKEETGQKPILIISLKYSGRYKYKPKLADRKEFKGQTWKLFVVEIKNKKIKLDKREHSLFRWRDFNKAHKLLTWPNQKKCLEIVDKELK